MLQCQIELKLALRFSIDHHTVPLVYVLRCLKSHKQLQEEAKSVRKRQELLVPSLYSSCSES